MRPRRAARTRTQAVLAAAGLPLVHDGARSAFTPLVGLAAAPQRSGPCSSPHATLQRSAKTVARTAEIESTLAGTTPRPRTGRPALFTIQTPVHYSEKGVSNYVGPRWLSLCGRKSGHVTSDVETGAQIGGSEKSKQTKSGKRIRHIASAKLGSVFRMFIIA